jgi:hypothetical protein
VCIVTGDYAMQNVALQMGLRLVAPDGKRIWRTRRWALRCSACFQICKVPPPPASVMPGMDSSFGAKNWPPWATAACASISSTRLLYDWAQKKQIVACILGVSGYPVHACECYAVKRATCMPGHRRLGGCSAVAVATRHCRRWRW